MLDPLAPIPYDAMAYALKVAGRYKEALEQIAKAEELAPGLGLTRELLAETHLQMGQTGKAISELEEAVRINHETLLTRGKLCHAYGLGGRSADARRLLKEIEAREGEPESRVPLAVCHIGLGERPAALDALLGELDEEVATVRVTEIRDRFSVAEVQSIAPGASVQVRDRVVLK